MEEKPKTELQEEVLLTLLLRYETKSGGAEVAWQSGTTTLPMKECRPGLWRLELPLTIRGCRELSYSYLVREGKEIVAAEAPVPHTIRLCAAETSRSPMPVVLEDRWIDPTPLHRLMRPPLCSLLGLPDMSEAAIATYDCRPGRVLAFRQRTIYDGEIYLVGSTEAAGAWDPQRALPLRLTRGGYILRTDDLPEMEYKFVLRRSDGTVAWEEGPNRRLESGDEGMARRLTITYQDEPTLPDDFTKRSIEGTVAPLFALRTADSYGIGDLSDATRFVTYLSDLGQHLYQMLPFYDTTFTRTPRDSYPYNAITTYGLHPLYLDVRRLPGYKKAPLRKHWEREAAQLNALDRVDYGRVSRLKEEVIDHCYRVATTETMTEVRAFLEREAEDLLPYCLFCVIRDRQPGTPVRDYTPYDTIREEYLRHRTIHGAAAESEVLRYAYIQYFLYKQLSELTETAHRHGVLIKGDLPIGVGRNSVDVWVAPHLFHLDKEAGAPPDCFSRDGQDWGFPTYDWEAMAAEDYRWWRHRFAVMERHLDAIRIDHVLGFFRIWSIPEGTSDQRGAYYVPARGYRADEVEGVEVLCARDEKGLYHPSPSPELYPEFGRLSGEKKALILYLRDEYHHRRNEELWRRTALRRLRGATSETRLLLCAEDLGNLPGSMREVLDTFELLSLEVVRMAKKPWPPYAHPTDIPYLSVGSTATHDTSSLRSWWASLEPGFRAEIASAYGCSDDPTPAGLIRAMRRLACSVLLVLPMQDWWTLTGYGTEVPPEEEQINHPEDPLQVWDYRMPGTIDDLPKSLD